MNITESAAPFAYKTIRVTQGRIDKGLLAIPRTLLGYFPNSGRLVDVLLGPDETPATNPFTPYSASSREARIGSMGQFYRQFGVRAGDELVVQSLGDRYRIMTESQFKALLSSAERGLDGAQDEADAEASICEIARISSTRFHNAALSEFYRLSQAKVDAPNRRHAVAPTAGESVPAALRKLLGVVYRASVRLRASDF